MNVINKLRPVFCSLFFCGAFFILGGCQKSPNNDLFLAISPDESGVLFTNSLTFDQHFNIYTYRNYYNGGGVALGDINNDGLIDIYFTGNMVPNKLYLNKGNFVFEDITDKAGVAGTKAWSTGVSMADVNGDGWLDIYVCNSGDIKGDNKQNELFINNGDLTFTEQAEQYGIADQGYTTHAAFFDYDNDGDLDLYILNNSYQAIGSFNLRKNERPKRDALGGDKLMRNDGDKFIDVSASAGIYGSVIGFGLGVTVGDINKDGWLDIFISNDFFERDYLYINNKDGTFSEVLTQQMNSISGASMGADLADINNDGFADIFVTEMLPHENHRIKTVTTFENWDRYQYNVENDYYHQFTRNMLQLNNGDGTFSEIGRLAGVEATDWSWGALMFDMDNDGLKDIFVANGIYQDLTNQDYLQYISNDEVVKSVVSGRNVDYKKLVEYIPTQPVPNFAFHNQGNLRFKNRAKEWGLGNPGFSNGSAYGDLDNDGDLDLVVNNVNGIASVFKNRSRELNPSNNYLKFELTGLGKNTQAIGTKITITHNDKIFYIEQMPIRGFQSTMDPRPLIGLGTIDTVEQVLIEWPDGSVNLLKNVMSNQLLALHQREGNPKHQVNEWIHYKDVKQPAQGIAEVTLSPITFVHRENEFVDFDRDHLIYHMLSAEGPKMTKGDVNNDGLEDVFIGGAKDQPGALFIQQKNGGFYQTNEALWEADKTSEDTACLLFDADGDGDLDLYVCSGGNEFSASSTALIDRLYLNDGKGVFTKSQQVLPTTSFESTSVVKAADFDNDGDLDLFVGVRLKPFLYGVPCNGYLLQNDGHGNFENVAHTVAPELLKLGMITDAAWTDIDNDGDPDLLIVGEYMPVKVFVNDKGKLVDNSDRWVNHKSNGWWNTIKPVDIDADGDIDLVLGNHGLNSRFRASTDRPVCMYINDFDQNGSVEQIICTYSGEESYPIVLRHDLVMQIPSLKKKYLKYENFKDQKITDIFTPDQMKNAIKLEAFQLSSGILLNTGNGKLEWKEMPVEVQLAPVYAIEVRDVDMDGHKDILLGGNFYRAKPEVGRYDASYGVFLKGDGRGGFQTVPASHSGFKVEGEIRDMLVVDNHAGEKILLVARNNDSLVAFKMKGK